MYLKIIYNVQLLNIYQWIEPDQSVVKTVRLISWFTGWLVVRLHACLLALYIQHRRIFQVRLITQ